jgi:hypothetical protein
MQYLPIIMFSAYRSGQTLAQNQLAARHAENDMTRMNIQFEKVLGVYQGSEEISYIVTGLNFLTVPRVIGMAKVLEQDSILLRDNENKCHLKYFDGRPSLDIGEMVQVTQSEAFENDSYTYSPRLKQYFICK